MIDLENNDILQICATVITGALIFLTLSLSGSSPSIADFYVLLITTIFGLGIIIFVSYAALKAISGKKDRALMHMRSGFLFIIIMAFIFVFLNVVGFYSISVTQ